MSNKILILGASGMLGWQITDKLLKVGEKLTLTVSNSNSEKKLRNKVNKNFILDSGTSDNSYVQNITSKYWSKFKAKFSEKYIF